MSLDLLGKRVLVVGAGRSGLAAAKLCAQRGARVTITDKRDETTLGPALASLPGVARELGGHRRETFLGAELIVLSPGVPEIPELAAARAAGVAITGEMELGSRFVTGTIVAITGTNGKSTTTTLIGDMMTATGRPTFVGGNLGDPLADAVDTAAAGPTGVCVVEASSFQLETVDRFHPRVAVLLNITADHLDRYPDMGGYAAAKARVFAAQTAADHAVVNLDDPLAVAASDGIRSRRVGFSVTRTLDQTGDGAGWLEPDALALRLPGGPLERYPAHPPGLVGRHNQANALAALLASRLCGATPDEAGAALIAFRPLAHRMELCAEAGGVAYYDDSKGTNVGAVVAALEGFPRPVVLIAGGRDKGGDYAPLAEALKQVGRAAVLIGEAADKLDTALRGLLPVEHAPTMEAAVEAARRLARPGDAVVLSPACSSFDMFRDYAHRAEVYRTAVARVAGSGGRRAMKKVVRRVAGPETAALKARVAPERKHSMFVAGALEVWGSLRARVRRLTSDDGRAAAPIRPSDVGVDRVLVGTVLALCAFGMVMVFSSGAVFAAKKYGDAAYFLKREVIYAVLGLGAMSLGARIDYAIYRRLAYPLLGVSIACLLAVLKVGSRAGGAIRWFRLGPLSFQPSELAKFAICVYLAYLLARKAEKVRVFSVGFLPPLLVTGVMMGLLLKQPDLGTAVIFGVVALGLLFIAGTRTSYLILALLVAAPAGWKFIVSTPFRMRRMLAFLDPWAFRRDVGYQITESLISVGSGGVTGMGLGDGRQKLFFLPEAHTDFILSIVGEELGLLGILAVIAGFSVLVWRGLRAATRARDIFGAYLAFGITTMFGLQALVNIGVVLGSLPTKGLPLPFISYGGTSLVMSLFMSGVLANVSARNPEPSEWLLPGVGRRALKGSNRRTNAGPRIVVEVEGRRAAAAGPAEVGR